MKRSRRPNVLTLFIWIGLGAWMFSRFTGSMSSQQGGSASQRGNADLLILSGSENQELDPLIQRFARERGVKIRMSFQGSVDIMLALEEGASMEADAVWPANSLWLTLGDQQKVIRHAKGIFHSPVVLGVRRDLAESLGWTTKPVTIADILEVAEAGRLRFAMTSATQSNSGASAYLGFLHALAGAPPVLEASHLQDKEVLDRVARLLRQVHRGSGSSGWLKDYFVANPGKLDAMFNYESMIIEANRELEAAGREPLYAIYPEDGILLSDSPLGYVRKGDDPEKEKLFLDLQAWLLSAPIQKELLDLGRRTGVIGLDERQVDLNVFNPRWGIDVARVISPAPLPGEDVLRQALLLYQEGGLRKPSATAYVLDFSGSMGGEGVQALKAAMGTLLDPVRSRRVFLQPSSEDIHIIVPFDGTPRDVWVLRGNDPDALRSLLQRVEALQAEGGTDIYAALATAEAALRRESPPGTHVRGILLMTDGRSQGNPPNPGHSLEADILPVYPIAFGDADEAQLRPLAERSGARVFHGHKDLTQAFRNAKGYN
jgi:Ca-activated chloride channel family protein